jgi:amino acid adenylation domain-containing protein
MKLGDFKQAGTTNAELMRLVARFNDNRSDYPRDRTVHSLFAEQAAARPDALAIIHGEREYSYGQLERASNRFARFLIDQGVLHEELVAVMLDSPFESSAAILGVLKAGAAYVPIDGQTPFDRIRYLLDDTRARILVTEKRHIRTANRLHWECTQLDLLLCANSRDVRREPEGTGGMMRETVWDHVGCAAFDDISGGGWTSSYTGEWLGREVMDEYGGNIQAKLLPHLSDTTRVLEIACGSGISLLRLAPRVGFYYATDLSRAIIEFTGGEVARAGLRNVRLSHCPAHDTDRITEDRFDIVVLNSVIQCFSGYNYLRGVLRKAIAKMADRGVMFLGNLWDLDKKDQFVQSLVEFRNEHTREGYRTKVDRSEELFVPRAFLEDLRHDFPEIARVECSAMLGTSASELSEYGYDAILHVDKHCPAAPPPARRKRLLDLGALDSYAEEAVAETSGPRGLAYVMYTSGTSGQPKGVMVEHRAIARLVVDTDYVHLGPDDRILQTGSPAFDASTFEIWGALLNAGVLCRPPERAILDPVELARLIRRHGITTMWLTAGLFNQHVDSGVDLFGGLRQLLIGGERLSPPHVDRVREKHPQLMVINGYGPTENTTFTTCHRIERGDLADIPIGRPIANTQVLILDEGDELVPVGIVGEICAAGDGLARGYLNDPQLSQRKFVAHPWESGQRIYRTGDAGRWRADGTIEFVGRLDDQVKIRGHRIEPAEIEQHILQDAAIRQALVVGREVPGEGLVLVAYVAADVQAVDLRERLKVSLPDYMVPAYVVPLERMPLNANGKIDRSALPEPLPADPTAAASFVAPATETERQLAAIWQEVLGKPRIGATDNFFDWGGHSLKVTKAVSLIEKRLGFAVPLTVFFARPTIRAFADYLVDTARFGVAGIDDAMVPLNAQTQGPALFAFPPGVGDALGYVQLAALLPCRFYAFNFVEAESRLRDYADLIIGAAREGPCLLFGYSSGGNLAYHVARELEQRGRRVVAIIMVDSARLLHPVPVSEDEIERVSADFLGDESVRPYLASPVLHERARRLVRSSLLYVGRAVDHHVVNADIHMLSSEDALTEHFDADGTLLISQSAWAEVTRGRVCVHPGSGHHNQMLGSSHLDRNAELIRHILDLIRESESATDTLTQTS